MQQIRHSVAVIKQVAQTVENKVFNVVCMLHYVQRSTKNCLH